MPSQPNNHSLLPRESERLPRFKLNGTKVYAEAGQEAHHRRVCLVPEVLVLHHRKLPVTLEEEVVVVVSQPSSSNSRMAHLCFADQRVWHMPQPKDELKLAWIGKM